MRFVSVIRALTALVFAVSAGRTLAQVDKEPTTAQVVEAVARRNVAQPTVLRFEAEMGGKTVGFSVASLIPSRKDRTGGNNYRSESTLLLPDGRRMYGEATARLNDTFEPTEVQFRREVTSPEGERQSTLDRAEVQDDAVLLTREVNTDPPVTRSIPRAESPFVFGIEFFVQRVDLKRFPAFAVGEFNPQDGGIIVQHFKVESGSEKGRRLVSREDDGSVGYVFEFDAKGELVSWTEPPLHLVFKRCSRERTEELRTSLGGG